jgi:hypothetical protein
MKRTILKIVTSLTMRTANKSDGFSNSKARNTRRIRTKPNWGKVNKSRNQYNAEIQGQSNCGHSNNQPPQKDKGNTKAEL